MWAKIHRNVQETNLKTKMVKFQQHNAKIIYFIFICFMLIVCLNSLKTAVLSPYYDHVITTSMSPYDF